MGVVGDGRCRAGRASRRSTRAGMSATASVPSISASSSSKRRITWSAYVASSASTRISVGRTTFTLRRNSSRPSPPSDGQRLLGAREPVAPERARAADLVLPQAALRLVDAERDAGVERRAMQRRVDLLLVEAVADLVQDGEDAAEVGVVPARGDALVAGPDDHRERVRRVVQPPAGVLVADRARHLEPDRALGGVRERPRERRRRRALGDLRDQRHEAVAQLGEDVARPPRSSSPARDSPAARRRGARPRGSTPRPRAAARPGARGAGGRPRSPTPRARPPRRAAPRRSCAPSRTVSSTGIRVAWSWSRRTTRTIAASSPCGSEASAARRAGRRAPARRAARGSSESSVACTSPRASAPRGGIIVSRSQLSSDPAAPRSASTASRAAQVLSR